MLFNRHLPVEGLTSCRSIQVGSGIAFRAFTSETACFTLSSTAPAAFFHPCGEGIQHRGGSSPVSTLEEITTSDMVPSHPSKETTIASQYSRADYLRVSFLFPSLTWTQSP